MRSGILTERAVKVRCCAPTGVGSAGIRKSVVLMSKKGDKSRDKFEWPKFEIQTEIQV